MRKWLFRLFGRKWLLKQLDEKKLEILSTINRKVDLPGLDEQQENKLFTDIYDLIVFVIKSLLQ